MRKVLFVLTVIFAGCGGPQVDRLVGEPAVADKYTLPATQRTHPAIDGLQRFLAAMQANDADTAWLQLSADTRKTLQARATPVGLRGMDLLRLRKLPVADTLASAVPFDPVRMFAVPHVQTLQLLATPPRDDAVEQRVNVTGDKAAARIVVMRFEGYRWRIHLPDLKMPVDATAP